MEAIARAAKDADPEASRRETRGVSRETSSAESRP
jgi:hypothetical protein